ncbi:MAG TPA: hypothetical protein VN026_05965 [Bacteroidia bacterium]|jgi:hypothetical protein|nr:hypothetical protein [Bacteroidia bacterium]
MILDLIQNSIASFSFGVNQQTITLTVITLCSLLICIFSMRDKYIADKKAKEFILYKLVTTHKFKLTDPQLSFKRDGDTDESYREWINKTNSVKKEEFKTELRNKIKELFPYNTETANDEVMQKYYQ